MKRTPARSARESSLPDPASGWSKGLKVATGGQGVVAHAGVVLPRVLADRIGLTLGLRSVVARRGFSPLRDRGRLLADAVAAMIAGASYLSDVEALTRQADPLDAFGGAVATTQADSRITRVIAMICVLAGAPLIMSMARCAACWPS